MGNSTGNADKKFTSNTKKLRLSKNAWKYWDKKRKEGQLKQMIRFKKINQKLQKKEGGLKRYRDRIEQ